MTTHATTTPETLTTRQAVELVLKGKSKLMTVAQITEAVVPLTGSRSKTPKQGLYSLLYGENKKADGLVTKVGDGGNFKLNPKRRKA